MTGEQQWTLLARLVRPQGRKGEIIADIFTDFPERFASRRRVFLTLQNASAPPREMTVETYWLHQGRIVLKFQGIDSINDAEPLRGYEVVVPATERLPLAEDAVYISDLVGCELVDFADDVERRLGMITDVERSTGGAPDLLVVLPATRMLPPTSVASKEHRRKSRRGRRRPPAERELLVPFAKQYLVAIDLPAKRVVMRLPEGLASLNAEETSLEHPEE